MIVRDKDTPVTGEIVSGAIAEFMRDVRPRWSGWDAPMRAGERSPGARARRACPTTGSSMRFRATS